MQAYRVIMKFQEYSYIKIIFNVWADVPIFIRDGLWVWGSGIESGEGDDPQGGKGIDFWLFGDNSFGAEGAEKW